MIYEHVLTPFTPGGKSLYMNYKFGWRKMLAAFRALRQSLKIRSFYMMKDQNWKLKYQFPNPLPENRQPSK